jgi:secreted PhoX family phosphatase
VVYVGDDARDKFLYKYISDGRYHKADGRRNSRLLTDGQLWVAELAPASQDVTVLSGTGRWHKVDMTPAALVDPDTWVRAQPWFDPATFQLNRPEDAEIDPFDNSLYTSLTNNADDPATYTSYWPRGNKTTGTNPSEPLPSVIAVRRS